MSAELNACPFCKSPDVAVEIESNGAMPGSQYNFAFVACRKCGARGPRFDDWGNSGYRQQAAEAWNEPGEAAAEPSPPMPKPTSFGVFDDDGHLTDLPGVVSASSDGKEMTLTILDFSSAGFRLLENKQKGDEIALQIETPSGTIITSSGYVTANELREYVGRLAEFIFSYSQKK